MAPNDIVISVKNVTKTYRLYDTHADRVKEAFHPFGKKFHRTFNALTDVSFDIRQGESVGIIGRNGSGKSTLLQVICGILKPTLGNVKVQGRISALLELGAGFNAEFTGRENVYLNASILGLTRDQIDTKFDKIASFADIGQFLDQPVKTYSSGMYLRLAFAVSINVEPDILIVDEALAVGDELFQRKCFSKIKELKEQGSTILFVSHSAGIILELCDQALLLDQGEIVLAGTPKPVISKYHQLLYAGTTYTDRLRDEIRAAKTEEYLDSRMQEPLTLQPDASLNAGGEKTAIEEYFDPTLVPESTIVYADNNDYGVTISNALIETLSGIRVNNLMLNKKYFYKYCVTFTKPAFKVRFGMAVKTVSGLEICGAATATPFDAIDMIEKNTVIQVQFCFRCLTHPGIYFMNAGVLGLVNDKETFLDRRIDIVMYRVQPEKGLLTNALVSMDVEPSYTIIQHND